MKTVGDVMTPLAVVLNTDATVEEAAIMMRDHNVALIPIIAGENVIGVLTDRDIVVAAVAKRRDPKTTRVSEIMSRRTVEIRLDESFETAINAMARAKVRRLVVADRQHNPIGVVTLDDLAKEVGDRPEVARALHDISLASPEYGENTGLIH